MTQKEYELKCENERLKIENKELKNKNKDLEAQKNIIQQIADTEQAIEEKRKTKFIQTSKRSFRWKNS